MTLVYFTHAQDGFLLALKKKSLYGILNTYILPALFFVYSNGGAQKYSLQTVWL